MLAGEVPVLANSPVRIAPRHPTPPTTSPDCLDRSSLRRVPVLLSPIALPLEYRRAGAPKSTLQPGLSCVLGDRSAPPPMLAEGTQPPLPPVRGDTRHRRAIPPDARRDQDRGQSP